MEIRSLAKGAKGSFRPAPLEDRLRGGAFENAEPFSGI